MQDGEHFYFPSCSLHFQFLHDYLVNFGLKLRDPVQHGQAFGVDDGGFEGQELLVCLGGQESVLCIVSKLGQLFV